MRSLLKQVQPDGLVGRLARAAFQGKRLGWWEPATAHRCWLPRQVLVDFTCAKTENGRSRVKNARRQSSPLDTDDGPSINGIAPGTDILPDQRAPLPSTIASDGGNRPRSQSASCKCGGTKLYVKCADSLSFNFSRSRRLNV